MRLVSWARSLAGSEKRLKCLRRAKDSRNQSPVDFPCGAFMFTAFTPRPKSESASLHEVKEADAGIAVFFSGPFDNAGAQPQRVRADGCEQRESERDHGGRSFRGAGRFAGAVALG